MNIYEYHQGSLPLLISIPHAGTFVPEAIATRFTLAGSRLADTDWHVEKLYEFTRELGVSILQANYSRYVVDLNRSPDSASLYVGNPTSPVCPTLTFDNEPLYAPGREVTATEIQARIEQYWQPYHQRLAAELNAMRERHGYALLWDAHSIASEVPSLFAGVLPEFNFGTRDDASCPRAVADQLLDLVTSDGKFGAVLNGRFKGGYITQNYGRPSDGIYAVQLELSRRVYMDEAAGTGWNPQRAQSAQTLIAQLLTRYLKARS
ncbi:N-formylglutamate deformylase [Steroidobacter sp. S1-65]|uniref:N-formylglutamate deformylase n=1 Tax=Steroidobacter gossypii TaxID=2805490 RepID=A0ABS1X2I8_9GAMM|nr:N-formylglutamate deformylase [Steroidobacter gossypii]MBM0107446.1 N-formylglutamate deformylase [Steroidobacter gossypii]